MLGRRFLLLVAVLMGLTAIAASLAPREPLVRERGSEAGSATPTPTPSPAPNASLQPLERTISTTEPPAKVSVKRGQQLDLTVEGPELDSVTVLDEIEPLEEDSPALFHLFADEPGQHPITLVDSGRRIGTLVIRE
jgi:hypothetical protein